MRTACSSPASLRPRNASRSVVAGVERACGLGALDQRLHRSALVGTDARTDLEHLAPQRGSRPARSADSATFSSSTRAAFSSAASR